MIQEEQLYMTCKKMMTSNPACCTPSETVARAAKLMKSEDVGSIPVVVDHSDKRLCGIITDRDLTLQVIAGGLDPENTLVESVMTKNPVFCREDHDVNDALRSMSEHQIRRIPVVDNQNRLSGIIAQADVARAMHDETVGAVVEDISQSRGIFNWSGGHEPKQPRSAAKGAAVAMTLGAGLMYLLDPNRGGARRAYIREQASCLTEKTKHFVDTASHEVRKGSETVVSGARSLLGTHNGGANVSHQGSRNIMGMPAAQLTAAGLGGGLALFGLMKKSRLARTAAAVAGAAYVARTLSRRQQSPTHTV
jgi:CBS domain-containing protein